MQCKFKRNRIDRFVELCQRVFAALIFSKFTIFSKSVNTIYAKFIHIQATISFKYSEKIMKFLQAVFEKYPNLKILKFDYFFQIKIL